MIRLDCERDSHLIVSMVRFCSRDTHVLGLVSLRTLGELNGQLSSACASNPFTSLCARVLLSPSMLSCSGYAKPLPAADGAWLTSMAALVHISTQHCRWTSSQHQQALGRCSVSDWNKQRQAALSSHAETVTRPTAPRAQRKRPRRCSNNYGL